MENLDLACAQLGQELANVPDLTEKLVNDALAVLQEQGPYALFLYLLARGKNPGKKVAEKCFEFLKRTPQQAPLLRDENPSFSQERNEDKFLSAICMQLAHNLDRLLFARDLLQQALTYARYHLKAKEAKGNEGA